MFYIVNNSGLGSKINCVDNKDELYTALNSKRGLAGRSLQLILEGQFSEGQAQIIKIAVQSIEQAFLRRWSSLWTATKIFIRIASFFSGSVNTPEKIHALAAKILDEKVANQPPVEAPQVPEVESRQARKERMDRYLSIYDPHYSPTRNRSNLDQYIQSDDYIRHAERALVFYDPEHMNLDDAMTIARQREPANITMIRLYDEEKLNDLLGFTRGAFCEAGKKTSFDGALFKDHPNSVSVYSETYLWPSPGRSEGRKELAVLSLPAPALDDHKQPHWSYYMESGSFNIDRYQREMQRLALMVVKAAMHAKTNAFNRDGIKRVVISRYGQGNFLGALPLSSRGQAYRAFYQSLVEEIQKHPQELRELKIVLSEFQEDSSVDSEMEREFVNPLKESGFDVGLLHGDIKRTAKDGDLIINAWDPHSAPGNGNDADNSFDGQMGRSTGIGLTQNPAINSWLAERGRYIKID